MAASVLNAPQFQNEDAAFAYVESRLWPNGPVCHHCGNADEKRMRRMQGKTTRKGLIKCYECGKPFTVRMGTIFESSHLALHLWLQVIHLMCASKKGISTRQIQRMLSCSMKTAWFLTHRIREAMRSGDLSPLGGNGVTIEIDETLIGRQEGSPPRKGLHGFQFRNIVLTLVERGGRARSWHVDGTTVGTLMPIIRANVARETAVMTDTASWYKNLNKDGGFSSHDSVNHTAEEYVRRDGAKIITTNTVEGYYSIFKRGMKGVYQHCSERHLHRYLAEFDFRYSNREKVGIDDVARAELALEGFKGKRLTYQTARY
ncbi:IS1595 family transposase [Methylocystis sp. 9N]|uniref:IS1595 family transposase n=1 Tax=Methylocystis borbori TaxID=3118750 RepID=A0ABU7XJW0_9HYPH